MRSLAWLAQAGRLRAQGPPPAPVASGSRPSLGMPPLRPLQLLLVLVLLGLLCCSAEPAGPSSEASEAALLRLLPPRLPLRVVRSAEAAAAALRSDGAFTLLPEPGHAVDVLRCDLTSQLCVAARVPVAAAGGRRERNGYYRAWPPLRARPLRGASLCSGESREAGR